MTGNLITWQRDRDDNWTGYTDGCYDCPMFTIRRTWLTGMIPMPRLVVVGANTTVQSVPTWRRWSYWQMHTSLPGLTEKQWTRNRPGDLGNLAEQMLRDWRCQSCGGTWWYADPPCFGLEYETSGQPASPVYRHYPRPDRGHRANSPPGPRSTSD